MQSILDKLSKLLFVPKVQATKPLYQQEQKSSKHWVLKQNVSKRDGSAVQLSALKVIEQPSIISDVHSESSLAYDPLPSRFILKSGVVVILKSHDEMKVVEEEIPASVDHASERIFCPISDVNQFTIFCRDKFNLSDQQVEYIQRYSDVEYRLIAIRDCLVFDCMFSECKISYPTNLTKFQQATPKVYTQMCNSIQFIPGTNRHETLQNQLVQASVVYRPGKHCFSASEIQHPGWYGYVFPIDKELMMKARRSPLTQWFTTKPNCLCKGVTNIGWESGSYTTYIANGSAKIQMVRCKPIIDFNANLYENLRLLLRNYSQEL
jgi:hypothetical protein